MDNNKDESDDDEESDDENDDEESDDEIEDVEGPLDVQKAKKKTKSKTGKEKSESGVGALQIELAKKYIEQSSKSLASWKENTPTPFGIVDETFGNHEFVDKHVQSYHSWWIAWRFTSRSLFGIKYNRTTT